MGLNKLFYYSYYKSPNSPLTCITKAIYPFSPSVFTHTILFNVFSFCPPPHPPPTPIPLTFLLVSQISDNYTNRTRVFEKPQRLHPMLLGEGGGGRRENLPCVFISSFTIYVDRCTYVCPSISERHQFSRKTVS